jgi:hypothetical protein
MEIGSDSIILVKRAARSSPDEAAGGSTGKSTPPKAGRPDLLSRVIFPLKANAFQPPCASLIRTGQHTRCSDDLNVRVIEL